MLATFNGSNGYVAYPAGGLTLSGSMLYGEAANSVFSVPVSGGNPTVLASFNGSNGSFPTDGLTLSGGVLYGVSQEGGPFWIPSQYIDGYWFQGNPGLGTVFSVPAGGGDPTMLASFSGSNGAVPIGGLVLSGSTLYGTTGGEVFSIPVGGGSPTVLASVSGINGGLVLSGSTFYGTTSTGGVSNDGTVFSIPVGGGSPTVLASFNGSNGANPPSGLVLSGGTLFGVTAAGGASGDGTVFALALPLTWTGFTNGSWDASTVNWANPAGRSPTTYSDSSSVAFNDQNTLTNSDVSNTSITISGSVSPASVTFNNTGAANGGVDYTIGGGTIGGTCGLTKNGEEW